MKTPGEAGTADKTSGLAAHLVELKADAEIFRQGAEGKEMYLIEEGEVAIQRGSGGPPLAVLEKGDFFGEMALLERLPRSATATARTRCRLLRIDKTTFSLLLRNDPEIAILMMRKLSWRIRELLQQVEDGTPVHQPGGTSGAKLAANAGGPEPVLGRLTHEESGEEFLVRGREALIGRADPASDFLPDIDLTPLDPWRSTSRQHAKLERRGTRVVLTALSRGASGTLVNGESLDAGSEVELGQGAELHFGVVALRFEAA